MANWSYCDVELTGNKEDILFAEAELRSNIKDNWLSVQKYVSDKNDISQRAGYSGAEIQNLEIDETTISIAVSGRWCAPHKYFEDFAARHKLSGEYADEESGCDFFHQMKFRVGEKIYDKETPYFSQESIAFHGIDHYLDEYSFLAEEGPDWYDDPCNKEYIDLFNEKGYTTKQLREMWE